MSRVFRTRIPAFVLCLTLLLALPSAAQKPPTMAQFLSPPTRRRSCRRRRPTALAWLVLDAGKRNVYTAAAPDFRPVRLTSFLDDNGIDSPTGDLGRWVRGRLRARPHA